MTLGRLCLAPVSPHHPEKYVLFSFLNTDLEIHPSALPDHADLYILHYLSCLCFHMPRLLWLLGLKVVNIFPALSPVCPVPLVERCFLRAWLVWDLTYSCHHSHSLCRHLALVESKTRFADRPSSQLSGHWAPSSGQPCLYTKNKAGFSFFLVMWFI